MTIVTTATSSGPYTAVAQTTFAVQFQSAGTDEVEVTLDGVVVDPALYNFTRDDDGTGEVEFLSPVSGQVTIYSNPRFDQQTRFSRHGAWFPDQINAPLDKAAARSLWLRDRVNLLFSTAMLEVTSRVGKFVTWDADGDPYLTTGQGADSALRTDVGGSTGSSLIGYFSRSVKAKLDDWVSPLDYGAVGNGVADDTAAINLALATGRRVWFPKGYIFKTQGLHQITSDGQTILVEGTIIYDGVRRFVSTGVYGFQGIFRVMDQVENVTFTGSGTIDGNWRRAGATVGQPLLARDLGAGIYAYRAKSLRVEGIKFTRMPEDAIKAFNCPNLYVARSVSAVDICNVGTEIHSYANDPRTAVPWVGDVFAPSGFVSGFYDWIDDGQKFLSFGNGVGVLFHCGAGALPISHLQIEGHYRDCLGSICSEQDSSETHPRRVIINNVLIEGNYRGAATALSLNGLSIIRVDDLEIGSIKIKDVGNTPPAPGGQSFGISLTNCARVKIHDFDIANTSAYTDRTQYGIRILQGSDIEIRDGDISTMATAPIYWPGGGSSPVNVRVRNVGGAGNDYEWGALSKFTFSMQNVPASATTTLLAFGQAGLDKAIVPCPYRLVALTVRQSAAGGGNFTYVVKQAGAAVSALNITQADLSGSFDAYKRRAPSGATQAQAGDRVEVEITTDGSWVNTTDTVAEVWAATDWKA